MASPFPGMDPYLEDPAFWPDFHHRFLDCWCEAISDALPDDYEARLDTWVQVIEKRPPRVKYIDPDMTVSRGKNGHAAHSARAGATTLEPITIPHVLPSSRRQGYIKILHRPERSLVTVLELLSPANKENPGRQQYLNKRQAVLRQAVHLVELDLLVGGRRLPMSVPLPPGDYYYLLSHVDAWPNCDVYTWTMNDRLPTLPVPLKAPDADRFIKLADVFATTYQRGRYGPSLDYAAEPPVEVPPQLLSRLRRRRRR